MVWQKGPFSARRTDHLESAMARSRQALATPHQWCVSRKSAAPLFVQIYEQLRAAILSRRLRAGAKLPATRELARELGVARASVVLAYEQLLAEGYVVGRVGDGTYVSVDIPS